MVEYFVDIYKIRRFANGQVTSEKVSKVLKESTVKRAKRVCKNVGYKYIGRYKDMYGNYYAQYERKDEKLSNSECEVYFKQVFTKIKIIYYSNIKKLEIMEAKNNNMNAMNVIENVGNEVMVIEESRKAYGRPSVNEEKGWKLDHVIHFDFYHNAYIKSRMDIDELVKMVLKECNISPDDTSSWAKDIRTMIKYAIEHFDELMEESERTPDEENDSLSGQWIGDGIELQHEAFWVADDCVPHTFEEFKAEHIREGHWEAMLRFEGMTEEEFKADYMKRYAQSDAA